MERIGLERTSSCVDLDSDAADWALVLLGDGEAFGRIFDRRKQPVRRQARRLLERDADVEDALALVFLEAWRRRRTASVVDGSLLPWLLVTTANTARNMRRSRSRYERLMSRLPDPPPSVDPSAVDGELGVLAAMRTLTVADQQVLTLCVMEGLSEREAAEALQIAPGTVKSRLHRAKRRLAQRVQAPIGVTPGRGVRDGV